METADLLSEATNLMVLGMGTVFVFLTVLVFVTSLMSTLVNRIAPLAPVAIPPSSKDREPVASEETLLAVITAAIHAHRSRR
jgi:oxaloacetate decarboxylase (Na+ extruding) subunit gamma